MEIIDLTRTLPKHPTKRYGKRYLHQIEAIVLHHTVGTGKPEAHAKYHINTHGWAGIGYHFMIGLAGEVYQTNTIDVVCNNVEGRNSKVIGVSVIGNYDNQPLNENQKKSIKSLISLLRLIVGPKPVKGHKDFKATICPGKNLYSFIGELN